MVVDLARLIYDAALKLMSQKSMTPKEAVAQAKKSIPGAALLDTKEVEKKLQDHWLNGSRSGRYKLLNISRMPTMEMEGEVHTHALLPGEEWVVTHVPVHGENAFIIETASRRKGWVVHSDFEQAPVSLEPLTKPPMPPEVFRITPEEKGKAATGPNGLPSGTYFIRSEDSDKPVGNLPGEETVRHGVKIYSGGGELPFVLERLDP